MSLESATWAVQLSATDPISSDPRSQGDDHLRLIKSVMQAELSSANRQWVYTGDTVARESTTEFTIDASDQSSVYEPNRRVKITGESTGTVYGSVTSVTFSSSTAVKLSLDSGTLANETLYPYVSVLTNTSSALPAGSSSDAFSVTAYGAKGDGTTDDTASIQAAIDAAEANGGGTVHFPIGVYIVTDTITVDDLSVLLEGAGTPIVEQMFQTTVNPSGAVIKLGDAAFTTASKAIVKFIYQGANGEARLGGGMRNMVVFGNRSTDTLSPDNSGSYNNNNTYGIGVQVVGARYVTLDQVFTLWCAEDGIQTVTGGSQSVGSNNFAAIRCVSVSNGDDGYDISGGDSHMWGCHAGFNGGDGFALVSGKEHFGLIGWNNFSHGARITGPDVHLHGSFYDNKKNGILVSGDVERCNLDVICQDNGRDEAETNNNRAGILVSGTTYANIRGISGNKSDNTQTYGLRIAQTDADVTYSLNEGGVANTVAFISDLSGTQTLSGAGAVSLTAPRTMVATTGVNALTLADGYDGQEKWLTMKTDNGDGTLTPDNLNNGTTITFDDVGDSAYLVFFNNGWNFMGGTATLA